jgi:hypothetical protein
MTEQQLQQQIEAAQEEATVAAMSVALGAIRGMSAGLKLFDPTGRQDSGRPRREGVPPRAGARPEA